VHCLSKNIFVDHFQRKQNYTLWPIKTTTFVFYDNVGNFSQIVVNVLLLPTLILSWVVTCLSTDAPSVMLKFNLLFAYDY